MMALASFDGCLHHDQTSAEQVYQLVCREDFSAPGYCLIDCGAACSSLSLRAKMLRLKDELADLHQSRTGRELQFVSAMRFDQQESTKLHRDGGPEQSLLILGYEPTTVLAELSFADYSRCAHELGITPEAYLRLHNPMFAAGEARLQPYITHLECFNPGHSQMVIVNNSVAAHDPTQHAWQGVLHRAVVVAPDEKVRRIINSTMVASLPACSPSLLADAALQDFATTSVVHRRGYDKPHLDE